MVVAREVYIYRWATRVNGGSSARAQRGGDIDIKAADIAFYRLPARRTRAARTARVVGVVGSMNPRDHEQATAVGCQIRAVL